MEKAGESSQPKKLEVGDVLYSPHKEPSRHKSGHHWEVAERHMEKGYPFKWKLVKNEQPQMQGTTYAAESSRAMEANEERSERIARKLMGLPPEED